MNPGDRYFRFLGVILIGYAVMGRSFAYIGIPPLFIGEMVLLYGMVALARQNGWSRALGSGMMLPLYAYMAWCAHSTIPYLSKYGADCFRDAAVWGWGLFGIVTASLIACDGRRLRWLIDHYKIFIVVFLITGPFTWYMTRKGAEITAPWAGVELINVKGGDEVVHVAGLLAYSVLLGGVQPILVCLGTAFMGAGNFTGRASMLIFLGGGSVVALLRPKSPVLLGVLSTFIIGLFIMWAGNMSFEVLEDTPRSISVDQFVKNLSSLTGETDNSLDGSKAWRLAWWNKIIGYTFHGPYFWSGKGFGVNLANDDGFQVMSDASLRSPHNGHLTMLARAGVPGFFLWITLQLTWAGATLRNALRARRNGDARWSDLFFFLLVYWVAFMINASFDVYLENPMGGIWMWTLYGVGVGASWVYAHCPEALESTSGESSTELVEQDSHAEPLPA